MSLIRRLKRLLDGLAGESREGASSTCPPISCMEAMAKLQEYLDGELEDVSHEQVARHFEICKKCYPHLKLEERFREFLRRHADDEEGAPAHLETKVLALLETEEAGR